MQYFRSLYRAACGHSEVECQECEEMVGADDPVFIDFDGDTDDHGRTIDCSRYLCGPCGEAAGYVPEEGKL